MWNTSGGRTVRGGGIPVGMEWHEERHERADERIEQLDDRLWAVATALHERPELSYEEHAAAERLTRELAADGFEVETGVAGMPTAFVARAGSGRRRAWRCCWSTTPCPGSGTRAATT